MRELSLPSLFDTPPVDVTPAVAEKTDREARRSDEIYKDFIHWCFSFGSDFRNSPDVINLRVWCQKVKVQLDGTGESEVLLEARRLYYKRLELMTKKAESTGLLP